MGLFRDRREAGDFLAWKLREFANRPDVTVLALPGGGVPVAFRIARALDAPLDVFIVRKLRGRMFEDAPIGVVATRGVTILDQNATFRLEMSDRTRAGLIARRKADIKRLEHTYRGGRPPIEVRGKTLILVDDDLATRSSMRAAIIALRAKGAACIIAAVPVAPIETCEEFLDLVDRSIYGKKPHPFFALEQWYDSFSQTTDEEVRALLELRRDERQHAPRSHRLEAS